MKKIITLSIAFLAATVSFANDAPSRLTVEATGKNNVRVTVDETKSGRLVGESGSVFDNLAPGYHTVRFYQMGKMLYSAAVQIKPMYQLSIVLNKRGNAVIDEKLLSDADACTIKYSDAGDYAPAISYGDYTGIKQVMASARFDEQRIRIAKRAVDENTLSALQIKEMTQLLTAETAKLDFAKYAYGKTIDKNNYSIVCETLPFGDNKADLVNYIRNYR